VIASIHLPADRVMDLVEMLLAYGGITVEEAIAHLRDRLADQETDLLSPDASRQRPVAG